MSRVLEREFDSLRVEGGLLPGEFLTALRALRLKGQDGTDYGLHRTLKLRDEIGRYWRMATAEWEGFGDLRERQDVNRDTLTADRFLVPLLKVVFGFADLPRVQGVQRGERQFPITHLAFGGPDDPHVPLVLTGPDHDLDKSAVPFGDEGRRRSPQGLMQEYLNATDQALWGIVSNGVVLRILRDNPSMTRPAYLEVDLIRLFDDELYADFVTLWLVAHASRFAPQDGQVSGCWLEQWREQAVEQGERALGDLRNGVEQALRALGNGFLAHPDNQALRAAIESADLTETAYFQELLRLVYRLLFLITVEDRDILHPSEVDVATRALYSEGYSLSLLRDRARKRRFYDQHDDLWQGLRIALDGLARGEPQLGLPALGGLFGTGQCPRLDTCRLGNKALLGAVRAMTWVQRDSGATRINYRDMGTEELGSVYESLLELIPRINPAVSPWAFGFVGDDGQEGTQGNARRTTGSYYTPDSLVQELIKSALVPVLEQRLRDNPANPRQALLDIKVCDPACGSGHFLLAAARRLAEKLAELDAAGDQYNDQQFRHALRQVVQHCIYGVDVNPLAVELCKTAIWLEAVDPGRPLGFLDAHIHCGNALVGVFDPAVLEDGIPEAAFKPLTGDDTAVANEAKPRNRQARSQLAITLRMPGAPVQRVENMPEDTLEQVAAKQAAWRNVQRSDELLQARLLEDLYTSAFFVPKDAEHQAVIPTNAELIAAHQGELDAAMREEIEQLARRHRFFHWRLAFPQVFDRAERGFDVVLGNPPWERIKLQEREWFAARRPEIATARNAAQRRRLIEALAHGPPADQALLQEFYEARHGAEASSQFARSGRFPLTGVGDVNLYALFAEHMLRSVGQGGRAGVIVPTGIATDDSTKAYFAHITGARRLVSLYDFENREAIFPGVHRSYKFSLLTLGDGVEQAELLFFATRVDHLRDSRRRFRLTPDEFALINPNTRTCPVFRSERDAELTKKLYRQAPVLIQEATKRYPERNPWGIRFQAMFHMSNDSGLFRTLEQLEGEGGALEGNHFIVNGTRYLPLYEAKMAHHYDHRWATYERDGTTARDMTLAEKQNPDALPLPRYWVEEWEVVLRTTDAPSDVLKPWRRGELEETADALRAWAVGAARALEHPRRDELMALFGGGHGGGELDDLFGGDRFQSADALQQQSPLTSVQLDVLCPAVLTGASEAMLDAGRAVLRERCPKYLLGWRDICRSTDERSVIAAAIPWAAVNHKYPLFFRRTDTDRPLISMLLANLSSLPLDFAARQKIGGTNLGMFIVKQLPILPLQTYRDNDLGFVVPRIIELTYTAHDLKPFANKLGYHGPPFAFDPDRRHELKCELDAYYAHLYGLTRDELRYILDPADVMGEDYPSETFRGLKNKELREFGEYRTRTRVLEAYDRLAAELPGRSAALN